ncbi:hypothetical protein OAE58_00090 [Akkermansiaceae bacterium]|nr:hypothetical protein [Akkermansiaceae bacterium]
MRFYLFLLLVPILLAQQPKAPEPSFVRILPVGDMPPWQEKIQNGVRVQIPPPPGALPIEKATMAISESRGETLSLVLGKMTKYLPLDGSLPSVQLFEDKFMKGDPWVKAANRPGTQSLMLLIRDPRQAKPSWKTPIAKMIPDDLISFPPESLRFANISASKIVVRIDEAPAFTLSPGDIVIKKQQAGKVTLLIGTANEGQRPKRIYKNRLTIKDGERTGIFIYRSDGKAADEAPKIRFFPERPTVPKRK